MDDMMEFPKTIDEFMDYYKIVDTEKVYTNGIELVPVFRIKQWEWYRQELDKVKGIWLGVDYDGYADGNPVYTSYMCNKCGMEYEGEDIPDLYTYCPNCGSLMVDELPVDTVKEEVKQEE